MNSLTILLLALGIAILAVALYNAHKTRRVHLMLFEVHDYVQIGAQRQSDAAYQQLAALIGLYHELGLNKSLPPTRIWAASPDFLLQLALHAQSARPRTVVECGSGVSTVVLARCMQQAGTGHVYSLEHSAEFARQTRGHLARHGLSAWATVIDAPLRPHAIGGEDWPWYSEEKLPEGLEIDLLVVDGPPLDTRRNARYPAGPLLFGRLAQSSAVFMDDMFRDDEREIVERWQKEFPRAIVERRACEKGCAVITDLR